MTRLPHLGRWLGAALLVAGLGACDVTTDLDGFQVILQVDDLPVELGAGITAPVRPDRPSASSADVATDFEVASIDDLQSITLRPDMLDFRRSVAARGAAGQASGTVTGYVFVGGVPVPGVPVTVTIADDAVTDVSPSVIASPSSTIDVAAIEAFLGALPASEQPALRNGWQALSAAQAIDIIKDALAEPVVTVAVGLEVDSTDPLDPLFGDLTLTEIDVSAVITR